MTSSRSEARRHLDARLDAFRPLVDEPRPARGWVRAIRDALGMSGAELGSRLGVRQSTVDQLERSEANETIKLESLRRVADALDCDLVYALVPRTSLDATVQAQGRRVAARRISAVAHHMRLEDQAVDERDAGVQLNALATELIDRRGLWSDP